MRSSPRGPSRGPEASPCMGVAVVADAGALELPQQVVTVRESGERDCVRQSLRAWSIC